LKTANNSPYIRTSADLRIFIGVAVDGIVPGLSYLLTVANKGPDIAQNVSVRFPVPNGAFNKIQVFPLKDQVRCNTPPFRGTGDIVCSLGDLSPNEGFDVYFNFDIIALPGTKIPAEARVESETPDPNPADNIFTSEATAPPSASLDSARALTDPFRIEIVGQGLLIPNSSVPESGLAVTVKGGRR